MHIALDEVGVAHEEAGVEAAVAIGRGDGAGDEVERVEARVHIVFEELGPVRRLCFQGRRVGLAEHEPGFFKGLADGGKRKGAGFRLGTAFCQAFHNRRVKIVGRGEAAIANIDLAAGKDELAGHELVTGSALAHEDARGLLIVADENERCGIFRAHGPAFGADFTALDIFGIKSGFLAHRLRPLIYLVLYGPYCGGKHLFGQPAGIGVVAGAVVAVHEGNARQPLGLDMVHGIVTKGVGGKLETIGP